MLPMLVLYGTTDGQTARIARFVAEELRSAGSDVDLVEAHSSRTPDPKAYAGVIVLASVHVRSYQRSVRRWVSANAAALGDRPTAFLSVCLAVLQTDEKTRRDLAGILERFISRTCWQPTFSRHIAGALRYTHYNWIKKWVMRGIAAKTGGGTDTTRDYEYTDWDDLRGIVRRFHHFATHPEKGTTGEVNRVGHLVG